MSDSEHIDIKIMAKGSSSFDMVLSISKQVYDIGGGEPEYDFQLWGNYRGDPHFQVDFDYFTEEQFDELILAMQLLKETKLTLKERILK